jgi:hypothetical protein
LVVKLKQDVNFGMVRKIKIKIKIKKKRKNKKKMNK